MENMTMFALFAVFDISKTKVICMGAVFAWAAAAPTIYHNLYSKNVFCTLGSGAIPALKMRVSFSTVNGASRRWRVSEIRDLFYLDT